MTLKFRRLLLFGLFVLFIIISPTVILYSRGWRFNFKNLAFQKIGAIYVRTQPKDAIIKINNEIFPNNAGFIQTGTLIANLLPGDYEVKIEKNGYFPYFKNLIVEPALVAELINVVLIPEKIEQTDIFPSKLKGDKLADLFDKEKIIINNRKNNNYYLYNLAKSSVLSVNASFNNLINEEIIDKIIFYPPDSDKLVIETKTLKDKKNLYVFDTNRLRLEKIFSDSSSSRLLNWTAKDFNFYYIKSWVSKLQDHRLLIFNSLTKTETLLSELPTTESINQMIISDSGDQIAIIDGLDDLYVFNLTTKELQKIAHNAELSIFSPDNEKIAFLDRDGKLNVHFLKERLNITIGDVMPTGRQAVQNFYWHQDSNHLFVQKSAAVEFTEIDDRLPLNRYAIIDGAEDFYYEWKFKIAYAVQGGRLYEMEF